MCVCGRLRTAKRERVKERVCIYLLYKREDKANGDMVVDSTVNCELKGETLTPTLSWTLALTIACGEREL